LSEAELSAERAVPLPVTHRVLFLCSGNYYRSRFAERLFNWLAEGAALPWRADSRGLQVGLADNIGPISPYALAGLRAAGVPANGEARFPRQLSAADLLAAELVIAVKEIEHRPMLAHLFPCWAERIEYWHVHDLDYAKPEEALPVLERQVRALVARLGRPC
jgi:protein-tyrosine phosphatase